MLHTSPLLAALFLLPALSLAGIPPFSGFVAKLTLVQSGLEVGANVTVAISLAVSALTLFSMTKIWAGVFWGAPDEPSPIPTVKQGPRLRFPPLMLAPTAALTIASLAFVVFAAPLYELGQISAANLIDPTRYIATVLGP